MLSYDVERWLRKNLLVPQDSHAYVMLPDRTVTANFILFIDENEDLIIKVAEPQKGE